MRAAQRSHRPRRRPKRVVAPPCPPEGRRRAPQPVSASIRMGRTTVRQMLVTFSVVRRRQGLLDRTPCMLGGRWCAASERAPLWPREGSSPPRELSPSVKWKCAPATAQSSRCARGLHGHHVEIAMTDADLRVLHMKSLQPAHPKSTYVGGRRQHHSRHLRHK